MEPFTITFNSADGKAVIETVWYADADLLGAALAAVVEILGDPDHQGSI